MQREGETEAPQGRFPPCLPAAGWMQTERFQFRGETEQVREVVCALVVANAPASPPLVYASTGYQEFWLQNLERSQVRCDVRVGPPSSELLVRNCGGGKGVAARQELSHKLSQRAGCIAYSHHAVHCALARSAVPTRLRDSPAGAQQLCARVYTAKYVETPV